MIPPPSRRFLRVFQRLRLSVTQFLPHHPYLSSIIPRYHRTCLRRDNVSIKAFTDLEPSISESFHKLRVFHRPKALCGKLYPFWSMALSSAVLSTRLLSRLSSRLTSRLPSSSGLSTWLTGKTAGSADKCRSVSGRQPYIVQYTHDHMRTSRWIDNRWLSTAHGAGVYRKLAMSCSCACVCVGQSTVDLHFCQCYLDNGESSNGLQFENYM